MLSSAVYKMNFSYYAIHVTELFLEWFRQEQQVGRK